VRRGVLGAAEQDRRGAVGEGRGVARRHRGALALAEDRRERAELLHRGVRAQVGVAGDAEVRRDEVVEEPCVVGGGQALVAAQGHLVLGLAADPPLLGGDRHVVAHRQAGPRLDVARRGRREVSGADGREGLGPVDRRARRVGPQQRLAQTLADGDRCVGRRVHSGGDARLDLTEGDLVGDEDGGLEAGATGLLHVVGRRGRRERRPEHRLAGEVEVAAVLDDCARGNLADPLPRQPEPGDQAFQGGGQHVLVRRPGVPAVGAGERDAVAAEDGGAAWSGGGAGAGGAARRRGGHDREVTSE
jgi:hypothetical protein